MSDDHEERPEVSERVLRTGRTHAKRGTGGFADRHPKQARVLVCFQVAVLGLLIIEALRPPSVGGGLIITGLFMGAAYGSLARISLRQAWSGMGRAALVVLGTLWVALWHFVFIGMEKGPANPDSVSAAMALPLWGAGFFMSLIVWPLIVYGALRMFLPKSG